MVYMKEAKSPILVVDAIIERDGKMVLIERKIEPFKGMLAFPGGHVKYEETIEDATRREVKEETSLNVELVDILGVYSDPNRDPRYHTVSMVFIAKPINGNLRAGSDAKDARWFKIYEINPNKLAFDHGKIFKDYLRWKKEKRTYWSSR